MKVAPTMLVLLIGIAGSANAVQAQDTFPRGGWDGNNVRISVTGSKLLKDVATTNAAPYPGGGWDLNCAHISVTRSKLLK